MGEKAFISYAHADAAEAALARTIADRLTQHGCEVFIDQDLGIGQDWNEAIEQALNACDIFCTLLSAASLASPMVQNEIARVGARHRRDRRPELWPIRCRFKGELPYDIGSPLRRIQHATWAGEDETPFLLDLLLYRLRQLRRDPEAADLPPPRLCTLPRRVDDFTGREAELEKLCALLTGDTRRGTVSAIGGMGGIGKTSLALEAAWRVAGEFADGALFVDLRGFSRPTASSAQGAAAAQKTPPVHRAPVTEAEIPLSPGSTGGPSRQGRVSPDGLGPPIKSGDSREEPAATASTFASPAVMEAGAAPLTPEQAIAAVIAQLEPTARLPDRLDQLLPLYRQLLAGRRLLLLLDNARDQQQVRDLLPPQPVALIVTSRRRIALPRATRIDLDVLSEAEALALLREIIGVDAGSEPDLKALAAACGLLPLALRAAGAYLDVYRPLLADYLAELRTARLAAVSRYGADDPLLDVHAVLGTSLDQLVREDPALAGRFAMLTVFPAGFDAEAAAAVWQVEVAAARHALGQLAVRSLVRVETAGRRYRLHDLVRDLAAERLDAAEREEAEARHAEHYHTVLAQARDLVLQGHDGVLAGLALFDLERAGIEAGQAWAARHWEAHDDAARLAFGYTNAGAYVLSLRLPARQRIAWLETAVAACRRLGDRRGEGNALGNLGLAYAALGESRKAIEHHEQNLAIAREMGDRLSEGYALGNLGLAYAALGETRKAIEHHEQCLAVLREIGDRRGEGAALGNLGLAYAVLGEPRKAIEHHEQRLVIAREIGDRRGEGNALGNLSIAYEAIGERQTAIDFHVQALQLFRLLEDPNAKVAEAWLRERGIDPDGGATLST